MSPLTLTLVAPDGTRRGATQLAGELILGRELIVELGGGADPSVSRRHGRIFDAGGALHVEDLDSKNGTFVNGLRIERPWRLAPRDRIEVSGHTFVVGDRDAPETGVDLYARATIAATRSQAPERLRLVYELTDLLEGAPRAERVVEKLRAVVEHALHVERITIELDLDTLEDAAPFAVDLVRARVFGEGEVLRRTSADGTTALAIPFGLDPEPVGAVVAVAERAWSDDDVAFLLAATTLAAGALRRGRRDASLSFTPTYEIIGQHPALEKAKTSIDRIAPYADLSVLIVGETGTGKELFARRLHERSGRAGPFVPVNLAALPAELLESELFGHKKGAFTGATESRVGYVELAEGGTLFLDEIGEMPVALQAKLLRVLQERTITRLGDPRPVPVDIRLVAATHADLPAKIRDGAFREDLYYRIADQQTRIPPLRDRGADITLLVRAFIAKNRGRTPVAVTDIDDDALDLLHRYGWPGNVRQLGGTIRLAVIHAAADGVDTITIDHIDERIRDASRGETPALSLARELEEAERAILVKALTQHSGNKRGAAREMGQSINTLRSRIERYGIEEHEYKK